MAMLEIVQDTGKVLIRKQAINVVEVLDYLEYTVAIGGAGIDGVMPCKTKDLADTLYKLIITSLKVEHDTQIIWLDGGNNQ